jgi:hypothetical protein
VDNFIDKMNAHVYNKRKQLKEIKNMNKKIRKQNKNLSIDVNVAEIVEEYSKRMEVSISKLFEILFINEIYNFKKNKINSSNISIGEFREKKEYLQDYYKLK